MNDFMYFAEYIFLNLILILPVWFISYIAYKKYKVIKKENHLVKEDYPYRIDNVEQFKKYLPDEDFKAVKKNLFDKFYNIQMAKTNYDYDTLRDSCTDELFNMYKAQLEVMDLKAHKTIIDYYKLMDLRIYDVKEVNGLIELDIYVKESHREFTKDLDDDYIAKGHEDNFVVNRYIMTFVKKSDDSDEVKCPNCGAVIKKHYGRCEFCRAKINATSSKFVLSKETKIITETDARSRASV